MTATFETRGAKFANSTKAIFSGGIAHDHLTALVVAENGTVSAEAYLDERVDLLRSSSI
jgi:hypothetical protein